MAAPFRTTRIVEFHDTDMAGIMHFASFFLYMASAEHEFFRSLGFRICTRDNNETLSFPRVAASCQFKAPARCEQILDIAISVSRLSSRSLTLDFEFTHEGSEIATGQITCTCCRIDPAGPLVALPIPEDIANKLQSFMA